MHKIMITILQLLRFHGRNKLWEELNLANVIFVARKQF